MATDPESPPIGLDEVRNIARLANLDLGPEELDRMTRELGHILAYVRQLQELDLAEVEPTMGGLRGTYLAPFTPSPDAQSVPGGDGPRPPAGAPIGERLPLRPDEPRESLPRELALREAPRTAEDGFAVPAFVDEG